MKIKSMYKEGWRVFLRLFWFGFVLGLLQLPFNFISEYYLWKDDSSMRQLFVYIILGLVYTVTLLPFILYLVSGWTGEFIAPRTKRKKMHDREAFGIK